MAPSARSNVSGLRVSPWLPSHLSTLQARGPQAHSAPEGSQVGLWASPPPAFPKGTQGKGRNADCWGLSLTVSPPCHERAMLRWP